MTENSDFGTFGRYQEVPVEHLAPEMKAAYEFTLGMRGHLPGPSKIWLANPRLLQTITPTGAYFQTESTLTKAEIEIATNLINGKWHAAYSNSEHEQIGQVAGGLAPQKVQALIAGLPTSFDDPRQQVVYDLTFGVDRPARGAAGTLPAGAGAVGRQGHRRCDRPAGLVHRRVADIGRLRRPVSRGGSHPIAKQPRRRARRPITTTSTT